MGRPEELREFDKGPIDFFRELYADDPRMMQRAIALYKGSIHGRPRLEEVTVYSELFTTEMTPPNLEAILVHAGNRLLPHLTADEKSRPEGLLFPYLYDSTRGCKIGRVVLRFLLIEDSVKLPLSFRTQELQADGTDLIAGVEFEKDTNIEDATTTAVDKKIINLRTFQGTARHELEPRINLDDKGQLAWETSAPVIKPYTQEGDIFGVMLNQLDRSLRDLAIERDLPII